ncbi:phage portal protein family protein [Paludibacterium denitrificans]|uniref:phage portal protein family protein n=1 Tax=Paludibacterium denitrificans TaxID=2675226 RepID=UPI0024782731|nr:DUF935 family protein [Paludibacterium denitrificans]
MSTLSNKTASVDIYARLTEYFDKQTSKIVLGQTLATNTGGSSGGGAYALGKVHNEVREDILDADVKQLVATLARDYVKPVVDLNLGPQQKYPAIRLRINKPEDLTALAGVVDKLVRACRSVRSPPMSASVWNGPKRSSDGAG